MPASYAALTQKRAVSEGAGEGRAARTLKAADPATGIKTDSRGVGFVGRLSGGHGIGLGSLCFRRRVANRVIKRRAAVAPAPMENDDL